MRLLTDVEIKTKIDALTPPLVTEMFTTEWQSKDSPIQPCSVDLRIGLIQIPSETGLQPVQAFSATGDEHVLMTGATAVLTTIENLNMPANVAGVGFPPSHVSVKGLLMTNPGHVDPGYRGPMHFTVINMGRRPYTLRIGDPICTLLFFELDSNVKADWQHRSASSGATALPTARSAGLREEEVNRLAKDFVDVEIRAKKIANEAVKKAQWTAGVLAALVSILFTLISQFVPYYLGGIEESRKNYAVTSKQIEYLEKRVADLEKKELATPMSNPQILPGQDGGRLPHH
jgi:deoxycytidine triphosphate deaminase